MWVRYQRAISAFLSGVLFMTAVDLICKAVVMIMDKQRVGHIFYVIVLLLLGSIFLMTYACRR